MEEINSLYLWPLVRFSPEPVFGITVWITTRKLIGAMGLVGEASAVAAAFAG
jgi:hypothetical protein